MAPRPKLIAGLGNPGAEYAETRHNAGFWFLDALVREYHVELRPEKRFSAEACQLASGDERCWLLKPATFMNLSGRAVAGFASYYNIAPAEIIVIYDEIDLPPGSVRFKFRGGHGGHNGIRDIIQHLGSPDFYRVRIGVGHPGHRDQVISYVLGRPPKAERELIQTAIDSVLVEMPGIFRGDYEKVMHRLHSRE